MLPRNPQNSGPMAGLQGAYSGSALTPFGNQMGDDAGGSWLYDRAVQHEQGFRQHQAAFDAAQPNTSENMQLSMAHSREPMQSYMNPMWSKFYQAVGEAAPGGIRTQGGRGNPMPGLPNSPFSAPSTMFQGGQTSAVTNKAYAPAVQGLQQNKPRNPFQVG